jgi:hypothetical protein
MYKTNCSLILISVISSTSIKKYFDSLIAFTILPRITLAQQSIKSFCVVLLIKLAFFGNFEDGFSKQHHLNLYEISKAL